MQKEFIPYEQALELKELGFDEPCFANYTVIPEDKIDWFTIPEQGITDKTSFGSSKNYNSKSFEEEGTISAPLYQQAFRWFRENYRYDVAIKKRKFEIEKLEIYGESDPDYYFTDFPFDSYEESELKCLKKLIEIVKRKNK
jgi:hypothetical protein